MGYDITAEKLIDTLRAVANEKPDHVYTAPAHMDKNDSCYYVHTDPEDNQKLSPGCLVGAALHRLGVPLEELKRHEGESAYALLDQLCPGVGHRARCFAGEVQALQDEGTAWGEAILAAEMIVKSAVV